MTQTKSKAKIQNQTWGDRLDDAIAEYAEKTRTSRKLVRAKDLVWQEDRMARSALLVSDQTDVALQTLHSFIAEMPAGASTGKHRHTSEAMMHALSGRAYSIVDGERIDWEAGDTIIMPAMCWHQHFNASETEPFRYLAATNYPLTVKMGIALIETADIRSDLKKQG